MIIRSENDELYLLESLGRSGVSFYRWSNFTKFRWNADYEQMIYRKLYCERTAKIMEELKNYIKVKVIII